MSTDIPMDRFDENQHEETHQNDDIQETSLDQYDSEDYYRFRENFSWNHYNQDDLTLNERERITRDAFDHDQALQRDYEKNTDEDIRRIIDTISDPHLKHTLIEEIAEGRLESTRKVGEAELKRLFDRSLERTKYETELDDTLWDDDLVLEDHLRFIYQQKLNLLNQALESKDLFLDDTSRSLFQLIHQNIETHLQDNQIIGFSYKGENIVQVENGVARFLDGPESGEFLSEIQKRQQTSAPSIFANYLNTNDTRSIRATARAYIAELREDQRQALEERTRQEITLETLELAIRDINAEQDDIDRIVKKRGFSLKLNRVGKTIGRWLRRLFSTMRKHPLTTGGIVFSLISFLVGTLLSIEGTKHMIQTLKNKIPLSVVTSLKSMLPTFYMKYLVERTSFGQGLLRLVSFFGIEGLSLGAFSLVFFLGGYSLVLYLAASGLLFLFGKPLDLMSYIEYISCSILESMYIKSGLKTPYGIAETIAKYHGISLEQYYANQNKGEQYTSISWLAPVARLNLWVIRHVRKYYAWLLMGMTVAGIVLVTRWLK